MKLKAKKHSDYFVYLLLCANGAYYTGIAIDLSKRLSRHCEKKGAKFTRAFLPKKLAAAWKISGGRSEAQKAEHYIRKKGRAFKIAIAQKPMLLETSLRNELSIRAKSVTDISYGIVHHRKQCKLFEIC